MAITSVQLQNIILPQTGTLSAANTPTAISTTSSTPTSTDAYLSSVSNQTLSTASLQDASVSFSQLGSLLEVASSGTQQVASVLQQLQDLSQQASNSTPTSIPTLAELDEAFQQLLSQINQTTTNTTFGGTSLLDGSLSTPNSDNAALPSITIPSLTTQSLFAGSTLNLQTNASAADASAAVAGAQQIVQNTANSLSDVQSQTEFAAASVDTALTNNGAAASVLSEADLANGGILAALSGVLSNSSDSAQAQTGNLPSTVLSLLQE